MPALEGNYLDKDAAVHRTAAVLTRAGIGVKPGGAAACAGVVGAIA